jgi:hypothetical protein
MYESHAGMPLQFFFLKIHAIHIQNEQFYYESGGKLAYFQNRLGSMQKQWRTSPFPVSAGLVHKAMVSGDERILVNLSKSNHKSVHCGDMRMRIPNNGMQKLCEWFISKERQAAKQSIAGYNKA